MYELLKGPEKQSEQNMKELKNPLDNFFYNIYGQALHSAENMPEDFVFTVEADFVLTELACMCGHHVWVLITIFNFFGHLFSPWHQLPRSICLY